MTVSFRHNATEEIREGAESDEPKSEDLPLVMADNSQGIGLGNYAERICLRFVFFASALFVRAFIFIIWEGTVMKITTRIFLLLLAVLLVFSQASFVIASKAQPQGGQNTVSVTISVSDDEFLFPPSEVSVSPLLDSKYGYTEQNDTVSVLDALILVHEQLLGGAFTPETSRDYLDISSGFITKILGEDAAASSFFVNDVQPNDGILNPIYGSYTGYTADRSYLNDGDRVCCFFYQDKSYWSDYYAFFDKTELTCAANEDVFLTLNGFSSFFGCYPQEQIAQFTEPLSDIRILCGTDKNALSGTEAVTNSDGTAVLNFSEPGRYYISAESCSDGFTYFSLPWCTVNVSESSPEAEPSTVPERTFEPSEQPSETAQPQEPDRRIEALISNISASYYNTTDAWTLFDMVCGGYGDELENKDESIKKLIDETYASSSVGETAKNCIVLKALGTDPARLRTTDGVTFSALAKLQSFKAEDMTYVTDGIFALTAYNAAGFDPSSGLTCDELISYILSSRNDDGLYGYTYGGENFPDYDSTAMALSALAPYCAVSSEVSSAVDNILSKLSEIQSESGTFYSSNTDAMVIIGLAALGIDPGTDPRFAKSGGSLIDGLLSYALPGNSGFGYNNDYEFNSLATEQSFRALIAYTGLTENGTYNIYDIIPLKTDNTGGSGMGTGGGNTGFGTSNITVTVRVVGDTVHGEKEHSGAYPVWIPDVKRSAAGGTKASEVLKSVLTDNGYTVAGVESGYISSITTPGGVELGELTNGAQSGWLYTVNGVSPSVGINSYTLKDNDIIVLYYSDDYTKDTGSNTSGGAVSGGNAAASPQPSASAVPQPSASAVPQAGESQYTDLTNEHWAWNYITEMSDSGILRGYDDGTFRPEAYTTRAEFAMIVCRIFANSGNTPMNAALEFEDVENGAWYRAAVGWAAYNGIVKGVVNGGHTVFMPDENISREDICVILSRTGKRFGISADGSAAADEFTDASDISDYAADSVEEMRARGIVNGKDGGRFAPKESATRAEVCKMVALSLLDFK